METESTTAAPEAAGARLRSLKADRVLRARARKVIPGGMYGHENATGLPDSFPQFYARSRGARTWDVDGNEYIDLMCSWGPIILGHAHPKVEAAIARQQREGDCQNGPGAVMVELAELLVDTVSHADWAMFAKNGSDATTLALGIARAATGRQTVLVAETEYHGWLPWCARDGSWIVQADQANTIRFVYNDADSLATAVAQAGSDLAALVIAPVHHPYDADQQDVDPNFARAVRRACDAAGAVVILDEIRAGLRLRHGGSWEQLGVAPDLSVWSKALGNGQPISAVLGIDALRSASQEVGATGSFWFAAVAMAAAIATVQALHEEDAVATMQRVGERFRRGLAEQATAHGQSVALTGPVSLPFMTFAGDAQRRMAEVFTATAVEHGLYLHPRHNWFLNAAHTEADIDQALEATDLAFAAVRREFGVN